MSFEYEYEERYVVEYLNGEKKYFKTADEAIKAFLAGKGSTSTYRDDREAEIFYREGPITAKVYKTPSEQWPDYCYQLRVINSSTNKECIHFGNSREAFQPFVSQALKVLAKQ